MDYDYILNKLYYISEAGTILSKNGYDPAWNVAEMMHRITKLIITIQDEINQKQESE